MLIETALAEVQKTHSVYEGRTTSLGRPPWAHLKALRVRGTGRLVDLKAGLYWDEGRGLGTYYSADGRSYLCNAFSACCMALEEDVPFAHVAAGRHTGGVFSVNYKFDPACNTRDS